LQSLASFTPPPASDARDALRRVAREETPEWEPFAADAAPAPAGPVLSGLDEGPAPTRNRGLKLVVGALVIIVIVLAAIVIVDRRDADQRAAQTALPGPISYVTETSDTGTSEGATITETTTTEPQPVGPNRTPRALRIASVTALDPTGDNTENSDQVRLAVDGSPTTGWSTEIYKEGVIEKKRGVGLSLHLAVPSRVRRLAITSAPVGATVVIYGVRGAVPTKAPRDWIQLTDPKERDELCGELARGGSLTDTSSDVCGRPRRRDHWHRVQPDSDRVSRDSDRQDGGSRGRAGDARGGCGARSGGEGILGG
jgi:hypothetical protein